MKENAKNTLRTYFKFCLNYKWLAFWVLFSVVAASVLGLLSALFIKRFFDLLNFGSSQSGVTNQLVKAILFFGILQFLSWIFWRVANFTTTYFQIRIMADLENYCFGYLHKHSFSFFENNFVGSLVKRVKWFSRAFEVIADQIIWFFIPTFTGIFVMLLVLFSRQFWLGFFVLAWTIGFLAINFVFSKYKLKYDILKAKQETSTTGFLADTISNSKDIKFFNGYKREVASFAKETAKLKGLRVFSWNLGNYFEGVQGFLMICLEVGLYYLALIFWQKGVLTVGDFALIQVYLIQLFHQVWNFGKVLRRIYESLADAEEMTVILQTPHEITDIPKAKDLVVSQGKIEFRNVDFCYHKTRKVLSNFNLLIQPRERVALIGPSGSGKTTLAKLLLRTNDIFKGDILIDGQNIAKVSQESLRKSIGLVPQDPILFHRTLLENISYGNPNASEADIITAAKKAKAYDFISNFPDKYNTYVGERGVKLSGGERQRVAIARAILKNAPILILDEATSSLDSESERLIQEAIAELMKDKTVIVIAHRLSTIKKMDRIIVIERGKIKEQGSHLELLTQTGLYKKLWGLQAGGFVGE